MARGFARAALAVVALLGLTAALGAQGGDKAKVGEAVKSDLTRLAELERTWFEKNRTFTTDLRALGFTPTSGANITMAYASARSWAANATHPTLQPTTCFIVVSQPGSSGTADRPFCSESTGGGQVAAAPTQAAPRQQPAAVPPRAAVPKPTQAAVTKPAAPAVTQQAAATRRPPVRRPVPAAAAPTTLVVELPARAPSNAAALAATRAAGGVADAGVTEAVTPTQFTERLNAIVAAALEVSNARMPEVARDPYESTAEYQARVAQAYAVFQRRESEFYARNTRTYVVSVPVKGVKYDADREIVEFTVDPVALPTTRSFAASDAARLSVACYTRPFFWCSPEAGMSYDGTDLWRIPRATARSVDVLQTPLTLLARYVVGRRDDARTPAVSLISMELHAKGAAISRWDSATR
ncbi:MAG: hypothetical protein Q8K55_00200 [Gemmatimonadaceae bacterium]|nr:hypothetical protein [Gemmatimonadaceae bacterium]